LIERAISVLAALAIVYLVSVANIELAIRAVTPDSFLDETREIRWEIAIKGSRVNEGRKQVQDVNTFACLVALWSVAMVRVQAVENSGALKEVMDKAVDDNDLGADITPLLEMTDAEKKVG
jgi:hypothetical protein